MGSDPLAVFVFCFFIADNIPYPAPTSMTLPARGVGRGLGTSNSLRPQTTVPTVCPRIHRPATKLSRILPDFDQPPQCLGVVGAVEGKTLSSRDFSTRATHLFCRSRYLPNNNNNAFATGLGFDLRRACNPSYSIFASFTSFSKYNC